MTALRLDATDEQGTRILAALIACVTLGCTSRNDTGRSISPEEAKSAVIAFVREHPTEFIGDPDPSVLDSLALTDMGDGTFIFGAFIVCPHTRSYSATVDVGAGESYLYEGDLLTYDGRTMATLPRITRYHAAITDPEY